MHGEDVEWGPLEHLIARVVDVLKAGNWQRGNAGAPKHKWSPFPEPIDRPTSKAAPPHPRKSRLTPRGIAARIKERQEADRRRRGGGD